MIDHSVLSRVKVAAAAGPNGEVRSERTREFPPTFGPCLACISRARTKRLRSTALRDFERPPSFQGLLDVR